MTTQQERLESIKMQILTACRQIHGFQATGRLTRPQIQEAIRRKLTDAGHAVRQNYSVTIIYDSRPLGKPQKIDVIVDQLVGICLVGGDDVSERQRTMHRLRIEQAGLSLALVITMEGRQLHWRQIDVPTNR